LRNYVNGEVAKTGDKSALRCCIQSVKSKLINIS